MMCGSAGSGKSTYAKQLEAGGMVRLSVDVEAWARGVTTVPAPQEIVLEIEAALKDRLVHLVREGHDVVLDLSLPTRALRDEYRALLEPLGVEPETVHVVTDRATALERLRRRTGAHADDLVLDESLALAYRANIEVPTPDEGPLTVVRT